MAVIFLKIKAKNADVAVATASIFNKKSVKKSSQTILALNCGRRATAKTNTIKNNISLSSLSSQSTSLNIKGLIYLKVTNPINAITNINTVGSMAPKV